MPMRKRSKIADFCITMFFVFAMLFGIAVFCYPAFSSWWNEKAQTKVIESYNKAVGDLGSDQTDAIFARAADYNKAIADHVDEEDKGITKCSTAGGMQNLTVINESGVFSLIMQSKMPDARRFKRWVTSEILPSIRKTGGYVFDEEAYARRLLSSQSEEVIMSFTAALKALSRESEENNTVEHIIR